MKKITVIILLLAICLSMVACAGTSTHDTTGTSEPITNITTPSEDTTEPSVEITEPVEHTHSYAQTVTAPGCETEGYTTYTCDCGDTYVGDNVNAIGHSWSQWQTTAEPTEETTGTAERICSVCAANESKVLDKVIAGHTHSYSSEISKSATCTTEGIVTYTCSCGGGYTESIAKLGHDYKSAVTKPTCTAKGYTTYTCSRCNDSYKGKYTSAVGHSWGSWITTKEPTVSSTGIAERSCSVCNKSETRTLDKLIEGHTHSYTSKVTQEPTCASEGVRTYTCTCGDRYTDSIKRISHSYKETVFEPNCVSVGWTEHECSACGDLYYSDWKDPIPDAHNFQLDSIRKPTCTCSGEEVYRCSRCQKKYEVFLPIPDHVYEEWVIVQEPYRGVSESDKKSELGAYITPHDGYAERHCVNCTDYETKTIKFEDYFNPLDTQPQYSYEFYFIDDLGSNLFTGDNKTIYIETDNPDPTSVWFWADGKRVSRDTGFADVEYLAEYRITSGMDKVEGGFLTSVMAPDEAGTYSIELQEWSEDGYVLVKTLHLNVLDMQEQYDKWFDEVISTQTNDSMNPKEKMDAIVKFVTNGQFRYYNTNGERYLNLAASPNSPDFASKRWNSFISPNRLYEFAYRIGGFDEIHNCYGDYAPGTPEWKQIHAYIYVVYKGEKYYYKACPPSSTGYIETIQMINFTNTAQFTRIG